MFVHTTAVAIYLSINLFLVRTTGLVVPLNNYFMKYDTVKNVNGINRLF